jgi:tetratricopeptide (TPR) repeat protein
MKRNIIALALGLTLGPATVAAQHEDHGDVDARTELGKVSFANSGAPAAQSAFLRGLALLHNFQYPQAALSFREAEKLDPGFAMAYWGEAMTYNHGIWKEQDSVAARALLAHLGTTEEQRLAKAPTAREKDYLRTLDILYSTQGTKAGRDTAYSNAMQQLAARYSDDDDAQLFYALSLLSLPRTDSTYMRAALIAARVMREHPQHPGALHYVIHAYDDPSHASLGLAAARAYSKVATNAPHAQHMTSHIFIALGMWDDVVAANEVALHTNEAERGPAAVAEAMCGHAGLWLHYAYLQQARFADARKMMDGCRTGSASSQAMARGYAFMRLQYLIDAPQMPASMAAMPSTIPAAAPARFSLDYGTALDAYRRVDQVALAAAIDRLHQIRAAFDATPSAKVSPDISDDMRIEENQARALAAFLAGRKDEAETLLRSAAQDEDKLTFQFGPPSIEKPSHELLGEILLADGKADQAVNELELALKRTPGRSLTLLDLSHARRAAGNTSGADEALNQMQANHHRADR